MNASPALTFIQKIETFSNAKQRFCFKNWYSFQNNAHKLSKSLPETVPETRTSLPDTRNESSGSTRTEPYPKLDYPNRTETRKNATRSDTTKQNIREILSKLKCIQ